MNDERPDLDLECASNVSMYPVFQAERVRLRAYRLVVGVFESSDPAHFEVGAYNASRRLSQRLGRNAAGENARTCSSSRLGARRPQCAIRPLARIR